MFRQVYVTCGRSEWMKLFRKQCVYWNRFIAWSMFASICTVGCTILVTWFGCHMVHIYFNSWCFIFDCKTISVIFFYCINHRRYLILEKTIGSKIRLTSKCILPSFCSFAGSKQCICSDTSWNKELVIFRFIRSDLSYIRFIVCLTTNTVILLTISGSWKRGKNSVTTKRFAVFLKYSSSWQCQFVFNVAGYRESIRRYPGPDADGGVSVCETWSSVQATRGEGPLNVDGSTDYITRHTEILTPCWRRLRL